MNHSNPNLIDLDEQLGKLSWAVLLITIAAIGYSQGLNPLSGDPDVEGAMFFVAVFLAGYGFSIIEMFASRRRTAQNTANSESDQ